MKLHLFVLLGSLATLSYSINLSQSVTSEARNEFSMPQTESIGQDVMSSVSGALRTFGKGCAHTFQHLCSSALTNYKKPGAKGF